MATLAWSEALASGIEEVDQQHQAILSRIAKLDETGQIGTSEQNVLDIIDELLDDAAKHFKLEESYMACYSYPDQAKHEEAHRRFTAKIAKWREPPEQGEQDVGAASKLGVELSRWFTDHIVTSDKPFIHFLREQAPEGT